MTQTVTYQKSGTVVPKRHSFRRKIAAKRGYIDIFELGYVYAEDGWWIHWNHKGLVNEVVFLRGSQTRDECVGVSPGDVVDEKVTMRNISLTNMDLDDPSKVHGSIEDREEREILSMRDKSTSKQISQIPHGSVKSMGKNTPREVDLLHVSHVDLSDVGQIKPKCCPKNSSQDVEMLHVSQEHKNLVTPVSWVYIIDWDISLTKNRRQFYRKLAKLRAKMNLHGRMSTMSVLVTRDEHLARRVFELVIKYHRANLYRAVKIGGGNVPRVRRERDGEAFDSLDIINFIFSLI